MILKTSNGGQSWTELSPDLSTKDPSRIVSNGGIVGDNLGQYDGEVRLGHRVLEDPAGLIWAGTNDGKLWNTKDDGANWNDLTKNFKDLPAWGAFNADLAVDVRSRHGLRRRLVPPDGRPQALHLQDDGLRRDVDEDHRQHPDRSSARLRAVAVWQPEQEGDAVRRHRPRLLLLDGRRRRRGRSSRTDCRPRPSAGSPSSRASTTSSSRPTAAASTSCRTSRCSSRPGSRAAGADDDEAATSRRRSSARRAACSRRPAARTSSSRCRRRPTAPVKMEILDAVGKVIKNAAMVIGACRAERRQLGSTLRGADARRAADDAARQSAHLGRAAVPGHQIRRITHWGITPQTGIPLAAPGKYQVRFTVDGTALHAAVRGDQGSGDRHVGRRSADVDGDADADSRRHDDRPPRWSTRWKSGGSRSRIR